MTTSNDEARIRRRDTFLELANDDLFDVVSTCAQRVPMREIAGLIEGDDEAGTFEAAAGPRSAIAELLRARAVRDRELDKLAASLAKYEDGLMPCVLLVRLSGGATEVSVVALRMDIMAGDSQRN